MCEESGGEAAVQAGIHEAKKVWIWKAAPRQRASAAERTTWYVVGRADLRDEYVQTPVFPVATGHANGFDATAQARGEMRRAGALERFNDQVISSFYVAQRICQLYVHIGELNARRIAIPRDTRDWHCRKSLFCNG